MNRITDRLKVLVIGSGRFGKSRMVETAIAADVEFHMVKPQDNFNNYNCDITIWDEFSFIEGGGGVFNETKKSPLVYDKRKPKPYYRKGERW